MNRGEEDYIKVIYELAMTNESQEYVVNQQLVEFFSHSAQTVSEMVKKLHKNKLVKYTAYKGSKLTEEGRVAAIRLLRVHRVWEFFLVSYLGYAWDEVHEEAEGLEHATSERLEERLFHFLGDPRVCPLGNPIPDLDGNIAIRKGMRLWFSSIGKKYEVIRVADDSKLLKYLNVHSIGLGSVVSIIEKDDFGQLLKVKCGDREIALGTKVAESIFVKQINEEV